MCGTCINCWISRFLPKIQNSSQLWANLSSWRNWKIKKIHNNEEHNKYLLFRALSSVVVLFVPGLVGETSVDEAAEVEATFFYLTNR